MKYYINGQEVTRDEIKLKSYIEEYRFTLVKIFIIKYFKKNTAKVVWITALILAILFSIWLNASAEEITLESIIEKEEVTDQDIDKFIEIIESTQTDNEITPENIERSDKSYEEFMKEWERLHQIKYEEQRKNDVNEQAFDFIIKYEWYANKPYWDKKQYSCWYWMRCSKDTTWITKEKSKQFVIERIQNIRTKYNLKKYDEWLQIALISFVYNIWHLPKWLDWYVENWYTNWLKNRMKEYVYWGWVKLWWLVKRRNAEINLF